MMKFTIARILGGTVLAIGLTAGLPSSSFISLGSGQAKADVSINVGAFYDRLSPYGDWIRRGNTYVFVPAVGPDWRPYTFGHWDYTDRYGWIWVSDEPFGWATYHYGRWGFDDEIGWYWVPGTEWAPAWVSWRRSDNYIGWAPLPPDPDTGLSVNIDLNSDRYADRYWAVVPAPQFLAGNLRTVVIRRGDTRFKGVFHATQALGRVNVVNKVVVNNIIKVTDVERVTRQKVRIKQVREVGDVGHAGKAGAGDTVDVFAPKVEKTANDKPKAVKPVEEVARKRKNKSAGEANQPGQGTNVLSDKSGQTSISGQTQQGIVTQKKKTNEPGQGQAKGTKQLE